MSTDPRARALNIGLHPDLVNEMAGKRASFKNVDAAAVRRGLDAAHQEADGMGLELDDFLIERSTDVREELAAILRDHEYMVAVIGGGVRFEPALTHLFELLVNTVRTVSPGTILSCNTGPDSTIDAIRRWWPEPIELAPLAS